jgi:hypothetical protein
MLPIFLLLAFQINEIYSVNEIFSTDLPMGLRFQHKFHSGPITGSMIPKPPPSKWDDAEKWIVSPGHNDQSLAQPHHRPLQTLTGRASNIRPNVPMLHKS